MICYNGSQSNVYVAIDEIDPGAAVGERILYGDVVNERHSSLRCGLCHDELAPRFAPGVGMKNWPDGAVG